jgi:phage terminase large subunit-like protein
MTRQVSTLAPRRRHKMVPPERPDRATRYALDVIAGRIVAGRLVRLAAERHVSDLATGAARGLAWDAAASEKAISFFGLLHHYKGRDDLIVLDPWQCFIVGSAWGWKRDDGRRRFRFVYCEVASKNGKSTMAGGAGLLLAFFDGEPGAEVYSAATKRDQAAISWNAAVQMVKRSPSLGSRISVSVGSLFNVESASFFKPLGRDSDSDQGINPNGAIIDELHVHHDRDLLDNIEKAITVRRQPMIWKVTTAGEKRTGVWAEERADAVAVLENRATDDSLFAIVYTLDEGDDPFDEAVWPKANPGLGVSVQLDTLRERAAKAQRSPGAMTAYLRYNMNIPTAAGSKAISIDEWDRNGLEPSIPDGATVYAGLDLASVKDLTALVVVWRDPARDYHVECRFWCPEDGIAERSRLDGVPYADWARDGWLTATSGNVTDYGVVREEIRDLAARWAIDELGADRWNATSLATDLTQDGANIVFVPQTMLGLGPAWREIEKLVLEGRLRHGGHPVLRWMAGNVEVETDSVGNQKPSKGRSSERIDGIVALDMALGRAMVHLDDAPSKYEERGILAL